MGVLIYYFQPSIEYAYVDIIEKREHPASQTWLIWGCLAVVVIVDLTDPPWLVAVAFFLVLVGLMVWIPIYYWLKDKARRTRAGDRTLFGAALTYYWVADEIYPPVS